MSLEAKIEALTEALNANTKALVDVLAGREEALAAATKLADSTSTTRRSTKAADADDKPASSERSSRRSSREAPKEEPKTKIQQVQELYGAYINVDDVRQRKERLDVLRRINDYFRVERISQVTGKDIDTALAMIDDLNKGVIPKEIDEDDGDSGSLV